MKTMLPDFISAFLFNKNVLTFNVNETFSTGDNATKSYNNNNKTGSVVRLQESGTVKKKREKYYEKAPSIKKKLCKRWPCRTKLYTRLCERPNVRTLIHINDVSVYGFTFLCLFPLRRKFSVDLLLSISSTL